MILLIVYGSCGKNLSMELIKLKVKSESINKESSTKITEKFIAACMSLDASIFEPLIEEDAIFDDLDKYRFLADLKSLFQTLKDSGIEETIMKTGSCELCILGHPSYEFYCEKNLIRFAFVVEIQKGLVKNVFRCNGSSGWF